MPAPIQEMKFTASFQGHYLRQTPQTFFTLWVIRPKWVNESCKLDESTLMTNLTESKKTLIPESLLRITCHVLFSTP